MDTNLKSISLVQRLHEVLFSLNIGFAIAFSLLAFIDKPIGPTYSGFVFSPATRLLLRSTVKLNQPLRLDPLRRTGREIIFITLILLIAILAFLLLRLIGRTVLLTTLLYPLGGLAALALVPALWLYALLDNCRSCSHSHTRSPLRLVAWNRDTADLRIFFLVAKMENSCLVRPSHSWFPLRLVAWTDVE